LFKHPFSGFKEIFKYLAAGAFFHFVFPGMVGLPAAFGPVDEPAQVPGIEFKGRAIFPAVVRTIQHVPAFVIEFSRVHQNPGKKKQELALNMVGDLAPTLFIAVNGLDGNPQKLGHFLLGFIEFCPDILESAAFHVYPLFRHRFSGSCVISNKIYHRVGAVNAKTRVGSQGFK
jgi:hypothetical protein